MVSEAFGRCRTGKVPDEDRKRPETIGGNCERGTRRFASPRQCPVSPDSGRHVARHSGHSRNGGVVDRSSSLRGRRGGARRALNTPKWPGARTVFRRAGSLCSSVATKRAVYEALKPRSRRPKHLRGKGTPDTLEDEIIEVRKFLTEDGLDAGPETIRWHARRSVGMGPRRRYPRSGESCSGTGIRYSQSRRSGRRARSSVSRPSFAERVLAGRHHPLAAQKRT